MSGTAAIVEPGLKPHHPIQSMRTPRTASGMLWPGMVTGLPSSSYLPRRGPSSRVPASAAMAPERWTTVEPAKSCMPSSVSQPPPQIQCPTIGYMSPAKTTAKTTYTANLVRSSMVPHTMANETAQKATWNRNLAESGTCVHESPAYTSLTCPDGTARNQPSVPTSALPVPKASANPKAQKRSAAIARLTRIFATTLPTFFIRENPTSSIANPACINSTRHAVTITHIVSIASESSAVEGPFWAKAIPGNTSTNIKTAADNNASLRKSFLLIQGVYSLGT